MTKLNLILFLVNSLLLLNVSVISIAQVQVFEGVYQIDGYGGNASFEYRTVDGDTVFDGSFLMEHASAEALFSSGDKYFSFEGKFTNNLPIGKWQFQFGDFIAGRETEFVNGHYEVRVDGVQESATGTMIDGKPEGEWVHLSQQIKNSVVDKTLFKSTFLFKDGIPQRSFRIENEGMSLLGRFLRDGHAHDVWEFYGEDFPDATEQWYFSDGQLRELVLKKNDRIDTLKVHEGEIENPVVINLDVRYIQLLKLIQQISGKSDTIFDSRMNDLLVENAEYYKRVDDILSKLGESSFMPEFKVKVPYFPLQDNETEALSSIEDYFNKSETITNRILKSAPVQLLKLSDESVLIIVSAVEAINRNYTPKLREILDYRQLDILEYVERTPLISSLWGNEKPSLDLEVSYEDSGEIKNVMLKSPKAGSYVFEDYDLTSVDKVAEYVYLTLDSLQSELNKKLTIEQRQQELEDLEEQLVVKVTKLNALIDSLQIQSEEPADAILSSIKSNAAGKLKNYSAITDMDIRSDRVTELTNCFEDMGGMSLSVSKLPEQQKEIKKLYTERVWNPFTATLMDEEQKKRIKSAYSEVLVPYLVKEISSDFTCSETIKLTKILEATHQKMLELREKETSTLERRLKKVNDPEEVMELFEIQSVTL